MNTMPTWSRGALTALALLLLGPLALAQPEPPPDVQPAPVLPRPAAAPGDSQVITKDWTGAIRVLRIPGATGPGAAEAKAATEIFPDSEKVWMHVHGTDPAPVEAARRGARKWICSDGCEVIDPGGGADGGGPYGGSDAYGDGGYGQPTNPGDALLMSIKAQTPTTPLPLTIWRPITKSSQGGSTATGATTAGKLIFDPTLLGRRSYNHMCAYGPIKDRAGLGTPVPACQNRKPHKSTPDSMELLLGFQWPRTSELSDFEYIAITDTCGNAWVQPFQRTFNVPAYLVSSGGCGSADGTVLRVFPSGGWVRVTAFNLDTPASGNVVTATFRVTIPALQDLVSAETPPMLFPDPNVGDIILTCGPSVLKAAPGADGIPRPPPGSQVPPGKTPPGAKQKHPSPAKPPPADKEADQKVKRPPVVRRPTILPASTPSGQPLAHQGLVIAPEPLWQGDCKLIFKSQNRRRLVAPLALYVKITRTDKAAPGQVLHRGSWIVTNSGDATYRIPVMAFDGESRIRLELFSDPLSADGNVVLLSDAGRLARRGLAGGGQSRLIGSVTIYTAPLCGEQNFETADAAGTCFRGYFTIPAMLATIQVTRAPWIERPLVTRNILSAVGVAFALDSYDPVQREAFPVALQLGGFVQDLGENRIGLLTYLGVAPTIPILGEGGNTTSIGLLGGIGMNYITRSDGPDEGFKPSAFLSVVVQVGQANPAVSANQGAVFGTFDPGSTVTPTAGTTGGYASGGYGSPSSGYGSPSSGYGDPYGSPSGGYGDPSGGYGDPYGGY